MENDLIRRSDALTEFEKVCNVCVALVARPMCGECSVADTVRTVKHIPAVDAVPVVRCRDCKHSDTFPVCGEHYLFPLKCLSIRYGGVFEDWFCEHGERR